MEGTILDAALVVVAVLVDEAYESLELAIYELALENSLGGFKSPEPVSSLAVGLAKVYVGALSEPASWVCLVYRELYLHTVHDCLLVENVLVDTEASKG